MKIIFICTKSITFNTFLKSQAEYFIEKGLEVVVACSDSDKLNYKENLSYKISFPKNIIELVNLFNYFRIFIQIKTLVKNNPSGIFYLHTPLASHLFRLFTYYKKLKIIYFVHGFRFTSKTNFIKSLFFKSIEKILAPKISIFITINNDDFKYVRFNLIGKASCYKVNGVGLDLTSSHFKKKTNIKKKIKKILVIAAYKKDKGYLDVLKVAELLKNKDIQIECYGYGSYNKFNSIKMNKNLHNISFNNFDINLNNKIKDFDILLHLSKREGLPVAVMQSLAEGLPVICYNIRGNNDLIQNRLNGFFVKSYKDVSEKIYYLNQEEKFFNTMRINAYQTINKDFSKNKINSDIYNIIKKYFEN